MMRPPLMSTDIVDLPPSARFLLSSRRDLYGPLLPGAAVDVDALALQLRHRRLREIGAVRARRRFLDHLELLRDPRRAGEGLRVDDADPVGGRPDERVDLVHLPRLVAFEQGRALLEDGVHAVARVIAAPDPALEGRREEKIGRAHV